jgi:hypothetical protein
MTPGMTIGLQLAGARLGDDGDQTAVVAAVLRRVAVGDDLHFADRVHVEVDVGRAAAAFVDDVDAVDADVLVLRRHAVDGERNRGTPLREVAIQVGVLHARQDAHHPEDIAALHLDVRDVVARDGRAPRTVAGLDGRDLGLDRDHLVEGADLQLERAEIARAGRIEGDVGGNLFESLQLDFDCVASRIE